MCAIIRPQRRPSSSPRRARSAISSATCRQSCARQPAKRSSTNWSSSQRLRAYVGREPASSRLLSSLKGPKPIEIVENGELDWRCEFPLLDADTLQTAQNAARRPRQKSRKSTLQWRREEVASAAPSLPHCSASRQRFFNKRQPIIPPKHF